MNKKISKKSNTNLYKLINKYISGFETMSTFNYSKKFPHQTSKIYNQLSNHEHEKKSLVCLEMGCESAI